MAVILPAGAARMRRCIWVHLFDDWSDFDEDLKHDQVMDGLGDIACELCC
jgi:hypothetical protein